jgi:hypothetical protein
MTTATLADSAGFSSGRNRLPGIPACLFLELIQEFFRPTPSSNLHRNFQQTFSETLQVFILFQ